MRLIGTYLWKEWRDHRAVLVGMLLAVPLLLVVMGFALPRTALDDSGVPPSRNRDDFAALASLACFALYVFSLATDLVPGEARRGHRWFLERLPGGLGAAFRGKLALFALGGALLAAYGYLGAAVTSRIVAGAWPSWPTPGNTTWIIAIAALWMFAVSCALPRGALSLPAVAALALLLAVPVILLSTLLVMPRPTGWWRWESGALWAAGGVVAAWAAFRRTGFVRAGRACLVVGALCAMPYWAHAGYGAYRWHVDAVPDLGSGFVGEGGRYVFLNRHLRREAHGFWHGGPLEPVVVDLHSGEVREAGRASARFDRTGAWHWYEYTGTPQRYVKLSDGDQGVILDARTAQPALPTEDDLRAARRLASPWRLGDGRRAWFSDGKLEADAEGGGFEVLANPDWSPCGLGLTRNRVQYYDLTRARVYDRKGLDLRVERVWIRPGRWLTRKKAEYRLFDPDSKTFGPAYGLEPTDDVRVIADDGRVFVRRDGAPALLDPETGVVSAIALPAELAGATVVESARAFDRPTRTPDGRRVFLLYGPVGGGTRDVYWCALARLDPGDRLAASGVLRGFTTFLGCASDDEAIVVVNETTVARLRFGTDECEEIWRVR